MKKRATRNHRAFTLIELVIVITILAILAAVAIPAFQNLTVQARNAGTQGALGGLRSGIAVYRANELAVGNAGLYPTLTGSTFAAPSPMENGIVPENPWARSANYASASGIVIGGATTRATSGTLAGWIYTATGTNGGLIYANSAVTTVGALENTY